METWWTESRGHAEDLAAKARREGFERVIAVGGDGTLFEVLNGLWWEPQGQMPSVGMVPFGTGCDYPRNFDLGRNLSQKLATAMGKQELRVDVGQCTAEGLDGKPARRVFVMAVGAGLDAFVVKRFQEQRFIRRGKLAYAVSIVQELLELKSFTLRGEVDGRPIDGEGLIFVAALGRYFGGGMKIAPGNFPWDGHFQLIWGCPLERLALLPLFYRIYLGRHVNHPKIHSRYARHVRLVCDPPVYVQAEGELIGKTPMELQLFPAALRFAAKPRRGFSGLFH